MKKQNPIYLFSTLMSLGVAGFVLFMLVSVFDISFLIIAIVFFLVIVTFIMYIAHKLNSHSFETKSQRLKECENCLAIIPIDSDFCPKCGINVKDSVICEYCGHRNKIGAVICEECNGLIG